MAIKVKMILKTSRYGINKKKQKQKREDFIIFYLVRCEEVQTDLVYVFIFSLVESLVGFTNNRTVFFVLNLILLKILKIRTFNTLFVI